MMDGIEQRNREEANYQHEATITATNVRIRKARRGNSKKKNCKIFPIFEMERETRN